ncbi:uncharacterized protein [Cherax quadricarinatus]
MATVTMENNGFRFMKALSECGRRVLHNTFCWGTPDKPAATTLDHYLNTLKQTSSANYLKLSRNQRRFNKTQKKLINESADGAGFDVPLLCLSIKLACENVASFNDPKWITPSTEMEYYITAVKNLRNDALHGPLAVHDEDYFENIRQLREVLTGCLKTSGERYGKDETEVNEKIKKMNDDLDYIMNEILGEEDIIKYCSDDIKQIIINDSCNNLKKILQEITYVNPVSFITSDFQLKVDKIFVDIKVKQRKYRGKTKHVDYGDLLTLVQTTCVASGVSSGTQQQGSSARPQILLLEGVAGSGKTTLVKLVTEEWIQGGQGNMKSLDNYDLLLWVQCRDPAINSFQDLLDRLIPDVSAKFRNILPRIIKLCKVIILVDGLDELNNNSRTLVKSLLLEFQNSITTTFMCTSRPEAVEMFSMTIPEDYDVTNAELRGIKEEHIEEFMRRTHQEITKLTNSNRSTDKLVNKVMEVEDLHEHLRLPMNLTFFVYIWDQEPDELNIATITHTELYHKMHHMCQSKLLERLADSSITKATNKSVLQNSVEEILKIIYATSLKSLSRDQLSLDEESVEEVISACNKYHIPYNEMLSAFLSLKPIWTWQGIEERYFAPHKGIQDYFSALHIVMTLRHQLHSSALPVLYTQHPTPPASTQPPVTAVSPSPTPSVSNQPPVTTVSPSPTPPVSTQPPVTTTSPSPTIPVSTQPPVTTASPSPTPPVSTQPPVTTVSPSPTIPVSTQKPVTTVSPSPTLSASTQPPVTTASPSPTPPVSTHPPVTAVSPSPTLPVSTQPPVTTASPSPTPPVSTQPPVTTVSPSPTIPVSTQPPVTAVSPSPTLPVSTQPPVTTVSPSPTLPVSTQPPVTTVSPSSTIPVSTQPPVTTVSPSPTLPVSTQPPVTTVSPSSTIPVSTQPPVTTVSPSPTLPVSTQPPVTTVSPSLAQPSSTPTSPTPAPLPLLSLTSPTTLISPSPKPVSSTPTPPTVSSTPTPPTVSSTPTPPTVSSTPTPPTVSSTPTPPTVSSTPTPPTVSSTPTPPTVSSTPTPPTVSSTPTPPPVSSTPAPPPVSSTPTPPPVSSTPVPPPVSSTPTPPTVSSTPTPPTVSSTPTPPTVSSTPTPPTVSSTPTPPPVSSTPTPPPVSSTPTPPPVSSTPAPPPVSSTPTPPPVSSTPAPPPVSSTPTPPTVSSTPVPPPVSSTPVPPPVSSTPVPPSVLSTPTPPPPVSFTPASPPVSSTPVPPPVPSTPASPPVSSTPVPPPVSSTPVPPSVLSTPTPPPPVSFTPASPPVSSTPVPPPVPSTPASPPVSSTPVPPPVSSTPVPPPVPSTPTPPPPVSFTPASPPVSSTPVPPPVPSTPASPPVSSTPVPPPVSSTPVPPSVLSTPTPPPPVSFTPASPPVSSTPVPPPVPSTPASPPVSSTPVPPPVSSTPVPPSVLSTPTPPPPVSFTPASPPVSSTPALPPVQSTPAPPPVSSTPASPPVPPTPASPPVPSTPVSPPVPSTPASPPVPSTPASPPVPSTPASSTPAPPSPISPALASPPLDSPALARPPPTTPTPASPVSIRKVLEHNIRVTKTDMNKYQNVLIHVAGLLHLLLDQLPEEIEREVVHLLHESGMEGNNHWLYLLQNTKISPVTVKEITHFFSTDKTIVVSDYNRVRSYVALLPYLRSCEVRIHIDDDPGDLPDLPDLLLALTHHLCKYLTLRRHYFHADKTTTSDSLLQLVQPRSHLLEFEGCLSAGVLLEECPSLRRLNLAVVSDDHARCFLPQLHAAVTFKLRQLKNLGVSVPAEVSPAALMSLPSTQWVTLKLTDVSDALVSHACNVAQELQPPEGYWVIWCYPSAVTVVGIQDMIYGLHHHSVMVKDRLIVYTSVTITQPQRHQLITLTKTTLNCDFTIDDESDESDESEDSNESDESEDSDESDESA